MEKEIEIVVDFEITPSEIQSLILLYQPVFAFPAMPYYLTLYEIGQTRGRVTERSLSMYGKSDNDQLIFLRQELERFNLLQTYSGEKLQLVLQPPLAPSAFMQHAMFGRLYSIVCGSDAYKEQVIRFVKKPCSIKGENISSAFDTTRLAVWDENYESAFLKGVESSKPSYFDIDAFFGSISEAMYPTELRTTQVRQIIAEVGSLYQMSYADMKGKLFDSTNFETKRFDTRKFVFLIEKSFGKAEISESDPYAADPVSFLRYKQKHEYIAQADRNLLESLVSNFGFDNKVINVLIEYVLETNDMNLNRSYVEKIAATWKRKGVESIEDALKEISQPVVNKKTRTTKKVHEMPLYSKDASIDEDEEALREELRRKLNEMTGKEGK